MKLKSFILTIGLSMFALCGLLAQDKYEYATIKYTTGYTITFTTQDNEEVTKSTMKDISKDLIKKVNQSVGLGWEVYNVTAMSLDTHVYFLRKKKN